MDRLRRLISPTRKVSLCGMVFVYFATIQLAAQTSATPLTLLQVIEVARSKNPNLLQLDRNLQGVRAQETQAGVRTNPNFTFYGTNVTLPAEGASNPYAYSFQVSRLFERGDKRRWRLDAAKATTEQTAAQMKDQERQIILSVKQAFTSMLIAKAAVKLAQENLGDFKKQLDIHRDRYQAGDIGKLDFERLDLQMAQFESDASTAAVNYAQASDQLQTLIGYERPSAAFDIAGDIVPPTLNAALLDLQQKALDARPDLIAAEAGVRAADANVNLAYANGTTDPTLEGEYDRSGTYNSAGFSVSIPLRIFDRNQGNKLTAKFQADASQFAVTAAHNQVLSDVDQAWVQYTSAKAISERYSAHYVDEAKDVLSIAQFAYQQGGLALIDYLNAVQENRATTLNALNAYSATWMAIHRLGFVTGTEVVP